LTVIIVVALLALLIGYLRNKLIVILIGFIE